MVVSFEHSPIVADLAERTREHFAEVVLPIEIEYQGSAHDLSDDTRIRLQQAARDGGVFAPQVSLPYGGVGLDMRSRATIFETADLLAIRTACAPLRTARRRKHAMLPTSEALVARWAGGRTFGNIHDLAAGWMACGEWCFVAFALTK